MPSNEAIPNQIAGVVGATAELTFHCKLVTGTSGAVAATSVMAPGVTVVKTGSEVGRYTFTLPKAYSALKQVIVTPIGAADAAFGAVSVGLIHFVRNDAVATTGTLDIQFAAASTNFSDAELPNSTSALVSIVVDRVM
jgi:hypothetical protein